MTTLSKMIDHTLLKAEASNDEIEILCKEAIKYDFKAVCVNPYYVSKCKEILLDSDIRIATVIGFPLGNNKKEIKAFEAKLAVKDGADEVDMVINIAALKNKDYKTVKEDILAVVQSVNSETIVKVIIETCYLTKEEKIKACEIAKESGVDIVKTSTGFGTNGAKVEDIQLMKKIVGPNMGIKASGGIRDYKKAKEMIDAGATRIGASAGIKIVEKI